MSKIITPGRGRGKEYNFDKEENKIAQLRVDGKKLGSRAVLLGSVLFSLVEVISGYINTSWIKHIDTSSNQIGRYLFWFIIVGVLGFLIAFIPARIGGGILASILCRVSKHYNLSPLQGFLTGAAVGLSAGACERRAALRISSGRSWRG